MPADDADLFLVGKMIIAYQPDTGLIEGRNTLVFREIFKPPDMVVEESLDADRGLPGVNHLPLIEALDHFFFNILVGQVKQEKPTNMNRTNMIMYRPYLF